MKKVLLAATGSRARPGRRGVRRRPGGGLRLVRLDVERVERLGGDKPAITVGSANFPENVVLAEIYAGALSAKDFDVSKKLNIGSREAIFPALEKGELTVLPEYSGALLSYLTEAKSDAKEIGAQVDEIKQSLPSTPHGADAVGRRGQGHDHLQQGDRGQVRPDQHRRPRQGRRRDHDRRSARVRRARRVRHQGAQARLRRRVQEVPAARRGRPADRRGAQGQQGPVRQPVQHAVGDPRQRLRHARGPEGPRRGGGRAAAHQQGGGHARGHRGARRRQREADDATTSRSSWRASRSTRTTRRPSPRTSSTSRD